MFIFEKINKPGRDEMMKPGEESDSIGNLFSSV